MVNTGGVFAGLCFCVDGFPYKQKQQLVEEIKKGDGSVAYAISKKTTHLVVPKGLDYANSLRIDQCISSGIPVVTEQFVTESFLHNKLTDLENFYNKEYENKLQTAFTRPGRKPRSVPTITSDPSPSTLKPNPTFPTSSFSSSYSSTPSYTKATNLGASTFSTLLAKNGKSENTAQTFSALKYTTSLANPPSTTPTSALFSFNSLFSTPTLSKSNGKSAEKKIEKDKKKAERNGKKTDEKDERKGEKKEDKKNVQSNGKTYVKVNGMSNGPSNGASSSGKGKVTAEEEEEMMASLFDFGDDFFGSSSKNESKSDNKGNRTNKSQSVKKVEVDDDEVDFFNFGDLLGDSNSEKSEDNKRKEEGKDKGKAKKVEEEEEEYMFDFFGAWDPPSSSAPLSSSSTPSSSSAPPSSFSLPPSTPTDPIDPETDPVVPLPDSAAPTPKLLDRSAFLCTLESETLSENAKIGSSAVGFSNNDVGNTIEEYVSAHRLVVEAKFQPPLSSGAHGNEFLVSITAMSEYCHLSFEELQLIERSRSRKPRVSHQIDKKVTLKRPEFPEADGGVWTWGWHRHGQLGRGSNVSEHRFPRFTFVPSSSDEDFENDDAQTRSSKIRQVSSGFAHCVCVTDTSQAAFWGSKCHENSGHAEFKSQRIPSIIDFAFDIAIAYVSCGQKHTAFVSDKGQLWTMGFGEHGQLGNGSFSSNSTPQLVESLNWNPVVFVSCGGDNTAAITEKGGVCAWGSNSNGQLGYESPNSATPTPIPMLSNQVICHVSVGDKHMAAVDVDGGVWTWGSNYYEQLGRTGWDSTVPEKLSWSGSHLKRKAIMVACGKHHSVALVEVNKGGDTEVYTWGRADRGALGISKDRPSISSVGPLKVGEFCGKTRVTQISCGAHHTAALTQTGALFLWGDNSEGQISAECREIVESPKLITDLLHVTQISCGGYHTCALVSGADELALQHARDGNYEQLRRLIKSNPELIHCAEKITGSSLLHLACQFNKSKVVEMLIENGANVNVIDRTYKYTPLHVCAKFNSADCANLLVSVPNINLDFPDVLGQTPLHVAVFYQKDEIVAVLVPAGCDKRAVDKEKETALHIATRRGNFRVAQYLVRKAAPITIHDSHGKTPLDYCGGMREQLKNIAQNHDVFISYAHTDIQFARKVRMELERNCIKCWMDDQRLEAGSDWRADIGNGILASRIIVFIASPTSIVSDWCLKELRMGEKQSKIIWPVWYQKSEVPTSVSVLFTSSKFTDLSTDELYQANVPHLVRKLRTGLSKLDRYELLGKTSLQIKSFHKIAGKPFSYLAYLDDDDNLGTTLKHLLLSSGVLCADDSMFLPSSHPPSRSHHSHHSQNSHPSHSHSSHLNSSDHPSHSAVSLSSSSSSVSSPFSFSPSSSSIFSPPPEEETEVDVNKGFWQEVQKANAEEKEESVENEGLQKCSVFVLVVSKTFLENEESKNKRILAQLKYAEQHGKPIVLIMKDQTQFAEDDPRFGHLHKHPAFHFGTRDLQHFSSEDMYDNLKRVVYVIELLYKEMILAEKVRQIEAAKLAAKHQEEEAKKLAEKNRLDEQRRMRKANFW